VWLVTRIIQPRNSSGMGPLTPFGLVEYGAPVNSRQIPSPKPRWHDFEFYYGDNWKIRRRVTLDYGFRWSFLRQGYHSKDKIAYLRTTVPTIRHWLRPM